MKIGNWECVEHYPGTDWAFREASIKRVTATADADGLRVEEDSPLYFGASGLVDIPASVLLWLAAGVR